MFRSRYVKFLSKRTIVSLIGIDYGILKEAGEDNIHKFYFAGLLVVIILLLSFFSVFYAFELMFHMWYAEVFLALFFALMFFTIYVLLIQTFSKEVLPNYKFKPFFNLSNISRIAFVFLISFIISQPIKIFLLRHQLNKDIEGYRIELLDQFKTRNALIYQKNLDELKQQIIWKRQVYSDQDQSIKLLENRIRLLNNTALEASDQVVSKISNSDFFVQRIILSHQYIFGWCVCVVIIITFGAPVFLIYSISSNSRYFQIKKRRDSTIVKLHYKSFKQKYTEVFQTKFSITGISFYEAYLDAPFNTIKKAGPTMMNEEDFKKKFLT